MSGPVLEVRNVHKQFPGVKALDGVDLCVERGEVHALLGENGAGKSTLLKILSGAQTADRGESMGILSTPPIRRSRASGWDW
jgi:ABC-type sugar transport system ATPase subunit